MLIQFFNIILSLTIYIFTIFEMHKFFLHTHNNDVITSGLIDKYINIYIYDISCYMIHVHNMLEL